MRDLGIFGLEFLNTVVIFEISPLNLSFQYFKSPPSNFPNCEIFPKEENNQIWD